MPASPPHIVHAIPHLRGAAGEHVVQVALAQHRRVPGSVALALSRDCEDPCTTAPALVEACQSAGVPVLWCGDFFRRDVAQLAAAATTLRDVVLAGHDWPDAGVVHAHTAMAAVVARKAGAPRVVATLHGVGRNRRPEIEAQDDIAWMLCDALMVPTAAEAARLRSRYGDALVHVVPGPFDIEGVVPVAPVAGARRRHRIGYAGPLDTDSHVASVIDAMPVVWQRVPDAQLHVVGDGDQVDVLREHAAQADATGRRIVVTAGPVDEVSHTGSFDVFASASTSPRADRASMTALAMGVPIVAAQGGALGELVDEGRCGLAVPTGSARDLGLAMAVLLEASDEALTTLATDGRRFAIARLGTSAHLAQLEGIYARPAMTWRERTDAAIASATRRWSLPDGPVRLHLGSGDERRPGWLNVDARPEALPDIVARVDALPMVHDASVDEIEACHLFEHLSFHEAHRALREWARVLKAGGRLSLELPNFDACVRILGTAADYGGHDFGMIGIFGWPPGIEEHGDAWTHRWGWTPATLASALETAGFTGVERLPVTQTHRPATRYDRDFRITAVRAPREEAG